ncbi:aldehyde dehydrogenase family protein [Propylenella binzhouense]|nr:aldehyde dehydrogenase family protein [Propylenella binzhouense]
MDGLSTLPGFGRARMTFGGRPVDAPTTFGVVNPATGIEFTSVPDCSPEQLEECIGTALSGFATWSRRPIAERRHALRRMADILSENADFLATLVTLEQGKPLPASAREIADTAASLRAAAEIELDDEIIQDDDRYRVRVQYRPLGPVAIITPWNYPVFLMGMPLGPALLAGNSVIVKPSPFTPVATLEACRLMSAALPEGVLSAVSGGNDLGSRLTSHPGIRKISFTGSVATGRKVAHAAVSDFKRFTLELGGNDAAILLDDVDLSLVGKGVFWGAFTNCGQICAGIKRLFVPDQLHDAVVDELVARTARVRIGDGMVAGMHLGPINNEPQLRRVAELVDDAIAQGAKVVTGAAGTNGPGYFYPLTILTDCTDDMRIVREEQFGPVLPILRYQSVDEAVTRANATEFGLSGSVWGRDIARAEDVAGRLDCGTAYVNAHLALEPHIPFGGHKASGIGVSNGRWGLAEFTNLTVRQTAR